MQHLWALLELTLDHFLGIVTNTKISCASLFDAIEKALVHPKSVAYNYAHPLHLLDTVLSNIMSENRENLWSNINEDFCCSFVLYHFDNEGWSIAQIPLCIIACIVFCTLSRIMPHHLAKTIGSINGFLSVPISAMLIWMWVMQSQDYHYPWHQPHHKPVSMR